MWSGGVQLPPPAPGGILPSRQWKRAWKGKALDWTGIWGRRSGNGNGNTHPPQSGRNLPGDPDEGLGASAEWGAILPQLCSWGTETKVPASVVSSLYLSRS